ncbi:hypothetical protein GQ55_8G234700 [Panicum hallii var. hallii]|uniref:Uncharacterized protein n=1 Tax=Panicum hallii var. hallii TaxID=1504633 RepID=A0A2T7CQF8_9POAL|nr:hypothetical protein GQ55_8G234700 [Panicum hallii var. hallii]
MFVPSIHGDSDFKMTAAKSSEPNVVSINGAGSMLLSACLRGPKLLLRFIDFNLAVMQKTEHSYNT